MGIGISDLLGSYLNPKSEIPIPIFQIEGLTMKRFPTSILWIALGVGSLLSLVILMFFDSKSNAPLAELPAYYWVLYTALFIAFMLINSGSPSEDSTSWAYIAFYSFMATANLFMFVIDLVASDLDGRSPFWLILGVSFAWSVAKGLRARWGQRSPQSL
jgi:hypothetical protein